MRRRKKFFMGAKLSNFRGMKNKKPRCNFSHSGFLKREGDEI